MDVEAIAGLRLPPAVEREVEDRLGTFVRHVMERDTRSRRFLEEVKAGYGTLAGPAGERSVAPGTSSMAADGSGRATTG
jgi:hypothetical protein